MKLKYSFVIHEIGNKPVAIAVGNDSDRFNGMIKLNNTGKYVFENMKEDTSVEKLADGLTETFDISREQALSDLKEFIAYLSENGLIEE